MITGLHHVQITVPRGEEARARAFYCDILGLTEVTKPVALRGRGGFWLRAGALQVHVGTEDGVARDKTKVHVGYAVSDLAWWRTRLEHHGVVIETCVPIPRMSRFEFRDPFGNRVELLQVL